MLRASLLWMHQGAAPAALQKIAATPVTESDGDGALEDDGLAPVVPRGAWLGWG
jgi:hypothetical protein